jgi:hypothetical protein
MMHRNRRWGIGSVDTAQELAAMLSQRTWTLCSGFYVLGHPQFLFLNDATCEDGAGEYGVVKVMSPSAWMQIESITFSWCAPAKALEHIVATLAGQYDANDFAFGIDLGGRLEERFTHRCHLCA